MKERIRKFLNEVLANEDHEATWYLELEVNNYIRWALVAAWMDYEWADPHNEHKWKAYCKLAYQPTGSLMQEYDIDWLYPLTKSGELYDTEVYFGNKKTVDDYDLNQIINDWAYIKTNCVKEINHE